MTQRSGLALAVLALAAEEPMHPYRMQQLIRERGKDQVVNVGQRSQLYKTVDRLVRDGLLVAQGTEREATRPERTVYAATDAGRELAVTWTLDMLTAPRHEFAEFTAALAYLPLLAPEVAADALALRLSDRRGELERVRRELDAVREHLPRIVLVEAEYALAHLETDVAWIAGLVDDLQSGALTWAYEDLIDTARRAASGGEEPP
ncbi:PadR family transcriptional regulator [Actinomycetospora cinnamomea]|uniref:DNA-binding PadR family transcriptional regulator n=1 Tax=Actinomycetospora cinnamomea TaxID=663609 RepID=A0A2U1F6V3_9PSEU|nr:helix-turn-helix transcriptional regulator [Actinomycetospora cinnamomea]PVZ07906.1 DNA-binding PadR family transcriptional regulator [Actinomycetospora cinnamomea]